MKLLRWQRRRGEPHRYGHDVGATRGVLRNSGDIIVRGELGSVVVGIQQMDDDISCGAESFRGVNLHGEELRTRTQTTMQASGSFRT